MTCGVVVWSRIWDGVAALSLRTKMIGDKNDGKPPKFFLSFVPRSDSDPPPQAFPHIPARTIHPPHIPATPPRTHPSHPPYTYGCLITLKSGSPRDVKMWEEEIIPSPPESDPASNLETEKSGNFSVLWTGKRPDTRPKMLQNPDFL